MTFLTNPTLKHAAIIHEEMQVYCSTFMTQLEASPMANPPIMHHRIKDTNR